MVITGTRERERVSRQTLHASCWVHALWAAYSSNYVAGVYSVSGLVTRHLRRVEITLADTETDFGNVKVVYDIITDSDTRDWAQTRLRDTDGASVGRIC